MDNLLKDVDGADFDDVLAKIENSFGFEFEDAELEDITTFGQFCDYVLDKIPLENRDDCTTQQAFHKLRIAMAETLHIDKKRLLPHSLLQGLLPRKNRAVILRELNTRIGFEISIIGVPALPIMVLFIILVGSAIMAFTSSLWHIGLAGIMCSVIGLRATTKFWNVLFYRTLGDVARNMATYNYLNSRSIPETYNKNEVVNTIKILFIDWLGVNKSKLTYDARL